MKATYKEIEAALNNTLDVNIEDNQEKYEVIRLYCDEAIENVGIQRTYHHMTKSDWKAVYKEIKRLIA